MKYAKPILQFVTQMSIGLFFVSTYLTDCKNQHNIKSFKTEK